MSMRRRLISTIQNSQVPVVGGPVKRLLSLMQIAREFSADFRAYAATSSNKPRKHLTNAERERDLIFAYHQIEKGLSFPEVKRPFGANASSLIADSLETNFPTSYRPEVLHATRSAHRALRDWNAKGEIADDVTPRFDTLSTTGPNWENFFESRRSCRSFKPSGPVAAQLVLDVAKIAQTSPSVCNRQSGRLHYFSDAASIADLLELQNGNRGFGHTVQNLFLVTIDRRYFREAGERNQRWVDGGLFAMTTTWGLHYKGMNTCMLNWSMGGKATRELRRRASLADHEDPICFIAFGERADTSRAARSERWDTAAILTSHAPSTETESR